VKTEDGEGPHPEDIEAYMDGKDAFIKQMGEGDRMVSNSALRDYSTKLDFKSCLETPECNDVATMSDRNITSRPPANAQDYDMRPISTRLR